MSKNICLFLLSLHLHFSLITGQKILIIWIVAIIIMIHQKAGRDKHVLYTLCCFQYKRIIKPSRSLCHKPVTQNHCQLIQFTVELIAHSLTIVTHVRYEVNMLTIQCKTSPATDNPLGRSHEAGWVYLYFFTPLSSQSGSARVVWNRSHN